MGFLTLDFFRKMPKDLTEPTFCGAIVSVVCTVVIAFLCINETIQFFTTEVRSKMLVDVSHRDDKLDINIDVYFPHMPCDILSLDIEDVMGTHQVDVSGKLYKRRHDKRGNFLTESSMLDNFVPIKDFIDRVRNELDEGQGCQVKGYFQINRVPGNFHISHHAFRDIVEALRHEGRHFNYTYKINHLSFGKEQDMKRIKRNFPEQGVLSPIDGYEMTPLPDEKGNLQGLDSKFYLIAIPSIYKDSGLLNSEYHAYQLTATTDSNQRSWQNLLFFNYELSPISVQFYKEQQSTLYFLIYICAIIGGVYNVACIVDSLIHKSVSAVFKKRIGKLS